MKIKKYLILRKYLVFSVRMFFSTISRIIRCWENKFIRKYSSMELKHQPVFIVGAPRTGSTILYQILTNQLDVIYIDNLICKFHRNLFFGSWFSSKLFNQRSHDYFKSKNGDTSSGGFRAPSECGDFWYRWLPCDRHFIDYDEITNKMIKEIRENISAITNYYDKPILFKNLNAGQRLRLLKKCFPNAKFIYANREPIYTAQSILLAKRKLGIADGEYWSIMPKNVNELKMLGAHEQIVKQIYFLQKQIHKDKELFQGNNFLTVDYIDLKGDVNRVLERCRSFICANKRASFQISNIKIDEKFILNEQEIRLLMAEIGKLDWVKYGSE